MEIILTKGIFLQTVDESKEMSVNSKAVLMRSTVAIHLRQVSVLLSELNPNMAQLKMYTGCCIKIILFSIYINPSLACKVVNIQT